MNLTGPTPDTRLQQALRDIVAQANVGCIIETGTYHGDSTAWFATIVSEVLTIENNEFNAQIASQNLKGLIESGKVQILLGDSAQVFSVMQYDATIPESDLFVLDAHYEDEWPLLAELRHINHLRLTVNSKTTALIDDFFVPGRPHFTGCYGGLRGDDSKGREHELIPCGYNPPFAAELDRFPHLIYPAYPEPNIGYCIVSDFELDLGPEFEVVR